MRSAYRSNRGRTSKRKGFREDRHERPRYPIGTFVHEGPVTAEDLELWTEQIAALPGEMRKAVDSLDDDQLDTPYRDGGWTIRQVVHHVPDSHLNGYVRMKLALSEDDPVIRPYDERAWANLDDSWVLPIAPSLTLLEAVHARWVALIRTLTPEQLARPFQHPESGRQIVDRHIGAYAWHGRHHLAHITTASCDSTKRPVENRNGTIARNMEAVCPSKRILDE